MEFGLIKRSRKRKRKRRGKKQRENQSKFEVRNSKRKKLVTERTNIILAKERLTVSTMQADSFWKNYTVAQEWQKRHSVTWWRSRCFALEYENQVLRDKIRSLPKLGSEKTLVSRPRKHYEEVNEQDEEEEEEEDDEQEDEEEDEDDQQENSDTENLEFHVDADMMTFLKQSIKHKIELQKKKDSESAAVQEAENQENPPVLRGAEWMQTRDKNAKLLYGTASPTILAMETALQMSTDRYKDISKPQYWPNIPLNS